MRAYIIIVTSKKESTIKVSSEAYRTLDGAIAFCISRNAKRLDNSLIYTNDNYIYTITDVEVI